MEALQVVHAHGADAILLVVILTALEFDGAKGMRE
jgi:hypothetical protein